MSTIPKAQATGRLNVVTRAHVTTIDVDNDARVSGVTYVKDGETYFQPADVILLASYTYENVRTLLLSTSKSYPNALANNHGQVGKHYMIRSAFRCVASPPISRTTRRRSPLSCKTR